MNQYTAGEPINTARGIQVFTNRLERLARQANMDACWSKRPQDETFESEWTACLKTERNQLRCNDCHRAHAGHSQTLADIRGYHPGIYGGSVVEDDQRPAPTGKLTRDGGVGDHGVFPAVIKTGPAGMQALIG